jgi:hypothetical protein
MGIALELQGIWIAEEIGTGRYTAALFADVLPVSHKILVVRQIRLDIVHHMRNTQVLAVALVRTFHFSQWKPFSHCSLLLPRDFGSMGIYNWETFMARV